MQHFNKEIGIKTYQASECVYAQGDKGNEMFIVRSGTLFMEVIIEVEQYQKHPIGRKKWELTTTVRKFIYRVRTLEAGDIFGHEELIPPKESHP